VVDVKAGGGGETDGAKPDAGPLGHPQPFVALNGGAAWYDHVRDHAIRFWSIVRNGTLIAGIDWKYIRVHRGRTISSDRTTYQAGCAAPDTMPAGSSRAGLLVTFHQSLGGCGIGNAAIDDQRRSN